MQSANSCEQIRGMEQQNRTAECVQHQFSQGNNDDNVVTFPENRALDQSTGTRDTQQSDEQQRMMSRILEIKELYIQFMSTILDEDVCRRYHDELRKHIELLQSLRPFSPEDPDVWTESNVQVFHKSCIEDAMTMSNYIDILRLRKTREDFDKELPQRLYNKFMADLVEDPSDESEIDIGSKAQVSSTPTNKKPQTVSENSFAVLGTEESMTLPSPPASQVPIPTPVPRPQSPPTLRRRPKSLQISIPPAAQPLLSSNAFQKSSPWSSLNTRKSRIKARLQTKSDDAPLSTSNPLSSSSVNNNNGNKSTAPSPHLPWSSNRDFKLESQKPNTASAHSATHQGFWRRDTRDRNRNSGFGSDNWRVRSNDVADSVGNDKICEKDDGEWTVVRAKKGS